jgi:hypothetical protein
MNGHRRGLRLRAYIGATVTAIMVVNATSASAASPPTDPAGFTAYVVKKLHAARPAEEIKVVGDLKLTIEAPAGEYTTDLRPLLSICTRAPDRCDDVVADRVRKISTFQSAPLPALRATKLRVVVRAAAYVDEMRRIGEGAEPVAEPLAGGLWLIGAAVTPKAIELLNTSAIAPLNLSTDQVLARGRKNLHGAAVKALAGLDGTPADTVAVMMGDDYQASLLAFPELWAPIAARGGVLYVTAPSVNMLMFCRSDRDDMVKLMLRAGAASAAGEERPLPLVVLRWTPGGWVDASGPAS